MVRHLRVLLTIALDAHGRDRFFSLQGNQLLRHGKAGTLLAKRVLAYSQLCCRIGISIRNSAPSPGAEIHFKSPACFSTTIW
jgi:hypothetical protein